VSETHPVGWIAPKGTALAGFFEVNRAGSSVTLQTFDASYFTDTAIR